MAFDRHMNLILGDCEEFRRLPSSKSLKASSYHDDCRMLSLVLLCGEEVVSMTVKGPSPTNESRAKVGGSVVDIIARDVGCATGRWVPTVPLIPA